MRVIDIFNNYRSTKARSGSSSPNMIRVNSHTFRGVMSSKFYTIKFKDWIKLGSSSIIFIFEIKLIKGSNAL
jgi:hypothetical protein